jgi:hypothetical protein
MPLIKSASPAAFKSNLKAEMHAGKPQKQALAIAYDVKRRNGYAGGGAPSAPWFVRSQAKSLAHTGPINSIVGGRTDHHAMSVPAGSYVLPSTHVSALGQGNTANGMAILGRMFNQGPYGVGKPTMGRGRPTPMAKMPGAPKIAVPKAPSTPPAPKAVAPNLKPPKFKADGGEVAEPVPIMAAGGEFVIDPETVRRIGGGDIDHGHKILDRWVMETRKKLVKTLRKLPGPAK